jgi:DNA-binding NarL/FixJ family response regulator
MLALNNLFVTSASPFFEEATAKALATELGGWTTEQTITVMVDDPWGFALGRLESTDPATRGLMVVITSNTCPEYLEDLWDLGPTALVSSTYGFAAVTGVIKRAAQSQRTRMTTSQGTCLTPRERQVLRYCAEGLTSKAIGNKLGVNEHSVSNVLSSIYSKLHLDKKKEDAMLYYWGMKEVISREG